jgi:hypothetical protein
MFIPDQRLPKAKPMSIVGVESISGFFTQPLAMFVDVICWFQDFSLE